MSFDFRQIRGAEDSKQGNFSALCTYLVMRCYADAKPVEGKGGDEGLDTFVGDFDGELRAFQHKYFLDRIGTVQRRQIRASLDQVLRHHKVAEWTLMIPKDLTPAEIRWFEDLRAKYPGVRLDWWGKTKLQERLAANPDLAASSQPRPEIVVVLLGKEGSIDEASAERVAEALSRQVVSAGRTPSPSDAFLSAAIDLKNRPRLRILVLGPGESGGDLWKKRCEVRDRLRQLGHAVYFGEDVISPEVLRSSGLNLTVAEYLQAKACDYVLCLMASPGSIGEVHDFAKDRAIACKMMVCVDTMHRNGYSAQGVLQIFEGYNGKLDWYKSPGDLCDCHLASRILEQVNNVANAMHWELAMGGKGP